MNKDNILKFLIPLVAVVVILESVIIVSGMTKKSSTSMMTGSETQTPTMEETKKAEVKDAVADIVFGLDNKTMQVGKKYTINVDAYAKKDFDIDAMDLFVKYDPEAFDVSALTYGDTELGKPLTGKVSKDKGLVVVNYWIADANGYSFKMNKLVNLVGFSVVPKKEGSFNFEIATGSGDGTSDSMIVEKASSKVLPFASNQLTVNVSK